jgi:flagellar biosynthetic protein FliP
MQETSTQLLDAVAQPAAFNQLATPIQLALMMGAMALLAGALVSLTSFTRIVIVLSFVRRALSTQEIPPNPVIIGLSLFLTLFIMGPTIDAIHATAIEPLFQGEITSAVAVERASVKLREFMLRHTRKESLRVFMRIAGVTQIETPEETPMRILIPAFVISELKTAFIMGFCIYVPFLLIDLVVSTILMSLGMMMMPPMLVSTPCKLMLFVLVDGWSLITRSLSQSFLV